MNEVNNSDSWLTVSYHFVIYFYLSNIMTAMTSAIISRIKDRENYYISNNRKFIKLNKNRKKGRAKYYFKSHKRQGVGDIKSRNHDIQRKLVTSLNTIVYKSSINKPSKEEYWEKESYPIAIDSCCSVSIAKHKHDFIGPLQKCNITIQGFNGSTRIKQQGTWKFKIEDDHGTMHDIMIKNTLLAPEAPYHLLSPQHWGQQSKNPEGISCTIKHNKMTLQWDGGQFQKQIKLDDNNNCGFVRTVPSNKRYDRFALAMSSQTQQMEDSPIIRKPKSYTKDQVNEDIVPVTPFNFEEDTQYPSEKEISQDNNQQKELGRWHLKLNHLSFAKIKLMASQGKLPKSLISMEAPFCPACAYSKSTRKPWRYKNGNNKIKETTKPGQCVSIDTFESSTMGFVAQLKGSLTNKRYKVATVFIDHYSDLSFVHPQEDNSSAELINAKIVFEQFALSCGVKIMHYHAENGRFADNAFIKDAQDHRQSISYCGVNAHHQNGKAEKRIRDLQVQGRVMLIHAMHKWNDAVNPQLWPYAIRMANEIMNITPRSKDGKMPLSLFANTDDLPKLDSLHPFGCPAYILENSLQQGKKIDKWANRSRVGMYLGPSPNHARTVHLILSIRTGLVSPQFHVTFDDYFESIKWVDFMPRSEWQIKARIVREHPSNTPDLDKETMTRMINRDPRITPSSTIDPGDESAINQGDQYDNQGDQGDPSNQHEEETRPQEVDTNETGIVEETDQRNNLENREENQPEEYRTRSGRRVVRTQKWIESKEQENRRRMAMSCTTVDNRDKEHLTMSTIIGDVMYLHQALKQPDKEEFLKAMIKEIDTHQKRKHWKVIPIKEVPENVKILDSIWAMRRKRKIGTGEISKYKARLNAHGGQQEHGINYWETYSPVVMWTTIRLILTLATIKGWHSRQLDFILAYPQADVDGDIYMKLPKGFEIRDNQSKEGYCLKLLKNIYGLKQAGRVWNQHLHRGLLKLSYSQSKHDLCLYYRKDTMLAVYIDDCILIAKTEQLVNTAVKEIAESFEITDEGQVDEYLGVKVVKLQGNRIKMSQPYLIEQIIEGLGFNARTKVKSTPAIASKILHRDMEGEEMSTEWDYARIIGQLNFLEKSTRPDISYAVHQCARFSSNPKASHKMAVLRIGRYLMATKSEGLILEPKDSSLELWCDADFSGNWKAEDAHTDRATAKSRTGYIIKYAGCPITWASKMQTETALSTTEAEFIALSEGLRTTIPIMNMMEEMQEQGISMMDSKAKINCKVFEDNSGALNIASMPKMRPRTKYINIKYWHFREHLEQGKITIHPVSTKDQIADILTKPLAEKEFEELKARVMGKEQGEVYTVLKGSVGNNEEEYIPYGKNKAVLNDEKRDKGMKEFKTRVHSASPNVFSAQGKTPSEDSNKVAMKPRKNQLNERGSYEGDSDS